jgi:hypothetical protein
MKRFWAVVIAAVVIAGVIAFKLTFPSYSYRYRLQISLSVDEKVYTGSSVIEVTWNCGPPITGLGRCISSLGGQAAVIDLGSRGAVVATLRSGEYVAPIPEGAVEAVGLCARAFGNGSTHRELPELPKLAGRRALSLDNFPRLVWFSNPADASTARKVTPENIASIVDPTARVTDAFVEITTAPVVVDITRYFPWLPALKEQQGKTVHGSPAQFRLSYNMFVGENS